MASQVDMNSHQEDLLEPTEALLEREAPPDVRTTRTASSRSVLIRIYVSHFLSTWNSRMFEFGAVLFLASIFQGTLLYASIYALVRSASAVVLSSWLGSKMDRSNRLVAIRHSIGRSLLLRHTPAKLIMDGYMTAYTS